MPRGVRNPKPTPTPTAPTAPEPIIIMQPDGENWHLAAYGLDTGEILRGLRLTLIHLAAQQSGVTARATAHTTARNRLEDGSTTA